MINPPFPHLAALARLADRIEYGQLVEWLTDESVKLTREAVISANPQACGAAALLQDLVETLTNVQSQYQRARNITDFAPTNQ